MVQEAKALQDTLLPFEKRQTLVERGQPVNPVELVLEMLRTETAPDVAVLAVALTLAGDGATRGVDGLVPKRAFSGEPLEQNAARQVALEAFPPEARLRKVGLEVHRKRLTLTFDFPQRAAERYADQIEAVSDQTGWDVAVNMQINQQALGLALVELLPSGGQIIKGPSFYIDKREVLADVIGVGDLPALAHTYLDLTGHRLRLNAGKSETTVDVPVIAQPGTRPAMEINAAYGLIREALEPYGLYRASLKQGQIVLSFISPQVGQRHQDTIAALAQKTGYAITIHPHPDQNAISQVATRLVREAGWVVRKGPGLHVDRAEVVFTLAALPDEQQLAQVTQAVEGETGYRLVVKS
jgi:hypothetical protein